MVWAKVDICGRILPLPDDAPSMHLQDIDMQTGWHETFDIKITICFQVYL